MMEMSWMSTSAGILTDPGSSLSLENSMICCWNYLV